MDLTTVKNLIPSLHALHYAIQKSRGLSVNQFFIDMREFLMQVLEAISKKPQIFLEELISDLTSTPIDIVISSWDEYKNTGMAKDVRKIMYQLEELGIVHTLRQPVGRLGVRYTWEFNYENFKNVCQRYGISVPNI